MYEAMIFDLDGTLWDATGNARKIWRKVINKHPEIKIRLTQAKIEGLMGKTMEEIGLALFPNVSEETRKEMIDEFSVEEVKYLEKHGGVLYDSVEESIAKLAGSRKLYIVSNCQDGYVQAFLHYHKMEQYFEDYEMSGRTGLCKGENIKMVMERNNIRDAVYIGDTDGDRKAAFEAKIPFIWVSYGFGKAMMWSMFVRKFDQLTMIY